MFWQCGRMHGGWRRRHWGPRPYFWGAPGCGCMPLFALIGLMFFICLISMCAGPHYYGF